MVQLADLFSVPEMGLLCDVTDYFERNLIDYHPEILFRDVKNSVRQSHPIMHQIVEQNVSEYIKHNPDLRIFFQRLKDAGKKLFLVTNSPFRFVNKGMEMTLPEGLYLEATLFGVCCATEDKREGTMAFLEKRPAQFKGK